MNGRDLTRQEIVDLLTEVGQLLVDQDPEAAIYVVGGTAMALEYDSRRSPATSTPKSGKSQTCSTRPPRLSHTSTGSSPTGSPPVLSPS